MFKPSRTPCKHYFCLECLKNHFEYEKKCPMCRTTFEESYKPLVNFKFLSKITNIRQTKKKEKKYKNYLKMNIKRDKKYI